MMSTPTNFPQSFPEIAGYRVIEQLDQGCHSVIYQAVQMATQQPVVIKALRSKHPSVAEVVQLRNQHAITQNLLIPGIIHTLSLERLGNSYALVMEDYGGIALSKYMQRQLLTLTEILEIALQLADILHDLDQHQIVHKDINPDNILIHPESKQVKLSNFSIATLLPKETQEIQSVKGLEGTLAYLAPEQTGRMNRGIDYRTDFYALGVTFYQLLSGMLPFESDDPLELMHCHIAKIPTPLYEVNPAVPRMVSAIVSKLMAKNAEDRYQSAKGLKYDLDRCLSQWRATGGIPEFELGQKDLHNHFLIPDKLYGRESEVKILLNAFERVTKGATELMLVAGLSGIGKTAVINEVHKPIVKQRGYFIKGKFDQYNRNIPLSAFIQAFHNLMDQLIAESNAQIQVWKNKILETVADNSQILIQIIPKLEIIIGKQPAVLESSGTATENLFYLLFERFTQVFASEEHPLVIFLDDLQWADFASLKLIQLLAVNTHHLLFIGAYRDHEVDNGHPLILTLDEIKKTQANVNNIILTSLNQITICHIVADTFSCSHESAWELSEVIYQKTQGNPFFTKQLLKSLFEDKLIIFNPNKGYWECNINLIKAQIVTDDVVDFMILKLQKLDPMAQSILQLAACIGNQFDLESIAIISQQNQFDTAAFLWHILQKELILPINQIYKLYIGEEASIPISKKTEVVAYVFSHDRIQQAAYSLIPEYQRRAFHLQIGKRLLANVSGDKREEILLEIVNHLNLGIDLISQSSEQEALAQLNLEAGRKAKFSNSYKIAIAYFETGIQLLPSDCWERLYPLSLALHQEITDTSYRNSDFAAVERWSSIVCQKAKTIIDTIKVQQNRIISANVQGKIFDSLQLGLSFLRSLGVEFPDQPTQDDIALAFGRTRSLWADKPISSLLDLPPLTDSHLLAQIEVLTVLSSAAYVAAPNLMPLLIFKQVEILIQFGNCPSSVFSYSDYGVILCGMIGDITSGYEFGELALSLRDRWHLSTFKSRNLFVVNQFIRHWKISLLQILPSIEDAYKSGIESGDLESAILNASFYCICALYQGQKLPELLIKMETYRQIIIKHKHYHCLLLQSISHQMVINFMGKVPDPACLTGDIFDADILLPQAQAENYRSVVSHWQISQLILYYLFNKNDEAARISAQALEYLDGSTATFAVVLYIWFDALVQLKRYPSVDPTEQQEILQKIQQQQDKLQRWANFAPSNHQHRWELVTAEKYRIEGNTIRAIEYYDLAIASATTNGFIQDAALANELAAKFYLAWGKEKFATIYIQEAYNLYAHWGAKAKAQDLAQHYPHLLTSNLALVQPDIDSSTQLPESVRQLSAALDLDTVLKANQALSREIHLDQLLQNLIQLIITNSGANKAAFFLNSDGNLELVVKYFDNAIQSLERKPIESCQYLPRDLIRYVERTQETVITDFNSHISTINDPYCLQSQPKSILCAPMLNQGQLLAILYLENSITSDVFNNERVELLTVICSQATISIANARLYEQSQSYAQQLERSLQNLSERESQFKALSQNVPGMIFKVCVNPKDFSESVPYVSSGCYDLYGVTAESLMSGEYFFRDFEHPEDFSRMGEAIRQCLENLTPLREEVRIFTKSGEMKWIQVDARSRIVEDGFIVADGIAIDITDRKQAEASLAESETKFKGLVEGVSDVIWSSKIDGTLTYLSPQFQTLFGFDPADWIGKSFGGLVHPDDIETLIETFIAINKHGQKINNQEFRHLCHDGQYLWVTVNAVPIFDADGKTLRHQGTLKDISERKKYEEELKQTNAELIRATRLKDEFLATMSHELRTPLNAVLGMTEALQEGIFGDLNEKQLKALATVEHSGNHLLELINDILDVSKIASGQIELNFQSVEIIPICQQSLDFINSLAMKKSIQIQKILPIDVPNLIIDERRIRQVLINLLNNAVKFTPEGGCITLEVIYPITIKQQNYLQINVKDTGIGITPEDLKRVFEPFVQVDSALNRNYEGTGLGLALVKRIVEMHHGRVLLTSELGVGSCFAIALPIGNRTINHASA